MTDLVKFEDSNIRRELIGDDWFFSVEDIVAALTDSKDPQQYVKKMKSRDSALADTWSQLCKPVPMAGRDGKKRRVLAANLEGIFRIVQSVPSPKAEPFKRWLAQVGHERVQETIDPERAINRAQETYRSMGMPEELMALRMEGIQDRRKLTDEWKSRGIGEGREYAMLTALIARRAVGKAPGEHRQLKGLKPKQNLRDHMTPTELLLTQLGETAAREITIAEDAQGFHENLRTAEKGAKIAEQARISLEEATGKPVATEYSPLNAAKQRLQEEKEIKRLN